MSMLSAASFLPIETQRVRLRAALPGVELLGIELMLGLRRDALGRQIRLNALDSGRVRPACDGAQGAGAGCPGYLPEKITLE